MGAKSKIRHLNRREPSADDRVLKQKGPLPINKFTQALTLFETLIAGGSRRNRDYCVLGSRLANMGSDARVQSGPRFGEDIHFATGMSRDRLLSCSRQMEATHNNCLLLTASGRGCRSPRTTTSGRRCGLLSALATQAQCTRYGLGAGCARARNHPQFQRQRCRALLGSIQDSAELWSYVAVGAVWSVRLIQGPLVPIWPLPSQKASLAFLVVRHTVVA